MSEQIQQNISRLASKHGITLGHLHETGGRELECVLLRFDAQAAKIECLRASNESLMDLVERQQQAHESFLFAVVAMLALGALLLLAVVFS
jgi:hypothetical protein